MNGPITLEDVRAALVELETGPNDTNAGVIRRHMGRGSLTTIQKHLERLRAELVQAEQADDLEQLPAAPADLVGQVWGAAYKSAAAKVANQLSTALQERDQARDRLAAALADLEALTTDGDDAEAAREQAEREAAQAQEDKARIEAALQDLTTRHQSALAEAERQRLEVVRELERKHELKAAQWATEKATLRATIDQLNGALADTKALTGPMMEQFKALVESAQRQPAKRAPGRPRKDER